MTSSWNFSFIISHLNVANIIYSRKMNFRGIRWNTSVCLILPLYLFIYIYMTICIIFLLSMIDGRPYLAVDVECFLVVGRIACKYSSLLSSNCPLTIRYNVCAIIPPYISFFYFSRLFFFAYFHVFSLKLKFLVMGIIYHNFYFLLLLCTKNNKRPAFHHLKERVVS